MNYFSHLSAEHRLSRNKIINTCNSNDGTQVRCSHENGLTFKVSESSRTLATLALQ